MGGVANQSALIPAAGGTFGAAAPGAPAAAPPAGPAPAPVQRKSLLDSTAAARPPGAAPGGRAPNRPAEPQAGTRGPAAAAPDPNHRAMEELMAQQQALSLLGVQAQAVSAELNLRSQQVGTLTTMSVQTFTDQAQSAKDGIKAQGAAFSKAG
jgi:hypothetical protein